MKRLIEMFFALILLALPAAALEPRTDSSGSIFIKSYPPGAEIWLDSLFTKRITPDTLRDVARGAHTLILKLTDYLLASQTVVVEGGEQKDMSVFLRKISASGPVEAKRASEEVLADKPPPAAPAPETDSAIKLTVRLGLAVNTLSYDYSGYKTASKSGIAGGLSFSFPLAHATGAGMRVDVLYSHKGWRETLSGRPYIYNYRSDALTIAPFLVYPLLKGKISPFLEAGVEGSINKATIYQVEGTGETGQYSGFRSSNFALNLGAGLLVKTGQSAILLDIRVSQGLQDMTKDDTAVAKYSSLQILAGYQLPPIRKKS